MDNKKNNAESWPNQISHELDDEKEKLLYVILVMYKTSGFSFGKNIVIALAMGNWYRQTLALFDAGQ